MISEISGTLSILINLSGSCIYVRDVIRGTTRPHIVTWVIWALLNVISGLAQYAGDAGWGAYVTAVNAATCLLTAALAWHNGNKSVSKSDLAFFMGALAIIPLWCLTKTPLIASILVTIINLLAYIPSWRKAWKCPSQENKKAFLIYGLGSFFAVLAIENYSFTTTLVPTSIFLLNTSMGGMLALRTGLIK